MCRANVLVNVLVEVYSYRVENADVIIVTNHSHSHILKERGNW